MENKVELVPEFKLFSAEIIESAKKVSSASKEEIKSFLLQLKKEYISKDEALKTEIKENIKTICENSKKELADLAASRDASIKESNDKFAVDYPDGNKDKAIKKQHSDILNGINISCKRASIKAVNVRDENIKNEKLKRFDLHEEYAAIVKIAKGKDSLVESLKSRTLENYANFNLKRTLTDKKMWANLMPLFMLIILIIAWAIGKQVTGNGSRIEDVITQGIFVAVVAIGAVYIYSQGGFDMSLGNAALMCAVVSTLIWNATGNAFLAFIVSLGLGALLGVLNAIFANMLNLPVMVMTLTMMNILAAVSEQLFDLNTTNPGVMHPQTGLPKDAWIFAIYLVVFFIICSFLFNFSKLGRRNKFIGSNKVAAKFNGINLMKAGIISFALSGLGLGLSGFLFTSYQAGHDYTSNTILSTVGLNVVIAIIFGGMTTSGGPKSRVSCALIGAFFAVFLDQFFVVISTPAFQIGAYRYMIKGIVFIVIALINMWDTRGKMLASGGSIQ